MKEQKGVEVPVERAVEEDTKQPTGFEWIGGDGGELAQMMKLAESEGLWFHCNYQDL